MTNNSIAFIGLCNEYCACIENARETELKDFVASMTRLLPRIYISAATINEDNFDDNGFIGESLEEESYDMIRRNLEMLFGEYDTYLEVFESDMKYSETPIGASIAEGLTDLFQVFYNFIETVRDAPEELVCSSLSAIKEDFQFYWGQTLCNVMRPLHKLHYDENE